MYFPTHDKLVSHSRAPPPHGSLYIGSPNKLIWIVHLHAPARRHTRGTQCDWRLRPNLAYFRSYCTIPVCTQPHLSLLVILCVLLERRRPIEVRTEEHHRFRRQRATRLAVPCTSHKQPASQPVASACGVPRGAGLLARTSTSPARRLYQPSPAGGASSGCSLTCPG